MTVNDVLKAYPEVFKFDGTKLTEQQAVRWVAGTVSEGSETQKYLFDIGEKQLAIEKLFRLGLRSSAVELSKSLLDQAVYYHQYHVALQICNYLVRHYYIFDNEVVALRYDLLYKTYRDILDLEYQAQAVYLRLTYNMEHIQPIDTEVLTKSVTELEKRLDIDSSTYYYYYFICRYYLAEGKDIEYWCLLAIDYFESQYFQHSAYESVFKKYIVKYYRDQGMVERALAMVTSFISKAKYGNIIWLRYMYTYIDLLIELEQMDLASDKFKEVSYLPQYQDQPEDKISEWNCLKDLIEYNSQRRESPNT